MKFELIDDILELGPGRIVAAKQVSRAEEYLADHFPAFPILPGVLMVETMAQAARRLLADECDGRLVLGEVRAVKFGAMVRPGETLIVEVSVTGTLPEGQYACRGTGRVRRHRDRDENAGPGPGETAVSGRFTMRPLNP